MTQVLYQDSAQTFVLQANNAIIEFLTNGNANDNLNFLSDFLSSTGIVFRERREERPMLSETNYPLAYVDTTDERTPYSSAASLHVKCRTRIIVWDSQASIDDAVNRLRAVAGAITSMLNQTIWDQNGVLVNQFDWSKFYSNQYPEETVNEVRWDTPVIELDSEGKPTGRAHVVINAIWFHHEVMT